MQIYGIQLMKEELKRIKKKNNSNLTVYFKYESPVGY